MEDKTVFKWLQATETVDSVQGSTGYGNANKLGKVNASVKYIICQMNLEQNKRGEIRWKPGSGQTELIRCHEKFLKNLIGLKFHSTAETALRQLQSL